MKVYKTSDYEIKLPRASIWIRLRPKIRWGWIFSTVIVVVRAFTV